MKKTPKTLILNKYNNMIKLLIIINQLLIRWHDLLIKGIIDPLTLLISYIHTADQSVRN